MGPNAAAQEFIDPAILGNPNLNPDAGVYDALAELVTLEGAGPRQVHQAVARAHRPSGGRARPIAVAPGAPVGRPARRCPAIGWLLVLLPASRC